MNSRDNLTPTTEVPVNLHIVLDSFSLVPATGRGGGFATYIINLVEAMLALDSPHRFTLFANSKNAELFPSNGPKLRKVVTPLPPERDRWPFRLLWQHVLLPLALGPLCPDVVHHPFDYGSLYHRAPAVVTIHDLIDEYYAQYFPSHGAPYRILYSRLMKRHSAHRARRIIAVSEATKQDICRHFNVPTERITVIHEAAKEKWVGSTVNSAIPTGKDPFFLTVGSTSVHKNIARTITGFLLAKERYHLPHRLVICGMAGQSHDKTLSLLDTPLAREAVVFLGFVSDGELDALYRRAEALLFLSLKEGFGLPPLEAMSRSTPVIVSDRPPMTEVVGKAGILVDPIDTVVIAEAVAKVALDPAERDRLVRLGQKQVQAFTWNETARKTLEVYEAVAGWHKGAQLRDQE